VMGKRHFVQASLPLSNIAEVAQLGERKTEVLEAASSILAFGKKRAR
jgi:hypothetical protein